MIILDLVPNTPEWEAARFNYFCASEAPIMMGVSPYMSRDDLLKYKSTGFKGDVTRFQAIIFDKGHVTEAKARPIATNIIGEDLYPLVCAETVDGMSLLASYDGVNIMGDLNWEHKQFNEMLFELVSKGGELEPIHYWQLEHQLMVNNADQTLFMVSDGTTEREAHLYYQSVPERRAQLIAHWKQFAKDLIDFVPQEQEPVAPVAEYIEQLPALFYTLDLTNGVKITHNLAVYKSAALELVERSKQELTTDQDFANAEKRVKVCKEAEVKIKSLISQVLGEITDVNAFKLSLEAIGALIAEARKNQEKKITHRKENRKLELINQAKDVFNEFIKETNENIQPIQLPTMSVDWAAAIKQKSSFDNMRTALNTLVATKKIEIVEIEGRILENHQYIKSLEMSFLFSTADLQDICVKDPSHAKLLSDKRVSDHKASEHAQGQERIAEKGNSAAEATMPEINKAPNKYGTEITGTEAPAFLPYSTSIAPAPMADDFDISFVDLSDFQRGVSHGLKLALQIFLKSDPEKFEQSLRNFIDVGVPNALGKAA